MGTGQDRDPIKGNMGVEGLILELTNRDGGLKDGVVEKGYVKLLKYGVL